jgi:Mce-associated membrane protein
MAGDADIADPVAPFPEAGDARTGCGVDAAIALLENDDVTDGLVSANDPDASDDDFDVISAEARRPPLRIAAALGITMCVMMAGLVGWLGFRAYQSHRADEQRKVFLQVGRQAALNLTTIDFQEADTDVQRILDSATGTFHDDFEKRAQPFIDTVKQAQSKSVGTVTEAGLESESGNGAQVLVAVAVKTSNVGAAEQQPRAWRMRISVQKVGDQAKVSNVEFVA